MSVESREKKKTFLFPFFSSLPNAFAGTFRSSISHYLFALAFGIWKCVVSCMHIRAPTHICAQCELFPNVVSRSLAPRFVVCVMFDRKVEVHKHDQRLNRKNGLVSRAVFPSLFHVLRLDHTKGKNAIPVFPFVQSFVRLFKFDILFIFLNFIRHSSHSFGSTHLLSSAFWPLFSSSVSRSCTTRFC